MSTNEEREKKLKPFASKSFVYYDDMYKIIDFLNKNIKERGLILGLVKEKDGDGMIINIYRV